MGLIPDFASRWLRGAADVTADRRAFFHDVMGVDEETFRSWDVERVASVVAASNDGDSRTFVLRSAKGTEWRAGAFDTPSIEDLRRVTAASGPGGGRISLVNGVTVQGARPRAAVDVGSLQADPRNAGAVFQVASNFNALETVGPEQDIDLQRIADYTRDLTQGPAASISAAPGLILRHYFLFHDRDADPLTWRQSRRRQINMLSALEPLDVTAAGYVRLHRAVAERRRPDPEDLGRVQVGVHRDIDVTHGCMLDRDSHVRLGSRRHTIVQVFTAAVDFGGTNALLRDDPIGREWAQTLLNAAYEGTLRAAAALNRRRVVLTLVGGGVFANDLAWIVAAIDRMMPFIESAGLDVTLIGYHRLPHRITTSLRDLVARTGGRYEE